MNHYFISDKNLPHDFKYIDFEFHLKKFKFLSDSGVFSKDHIDPASQTLVENIPEISGSLLDIGCGYGFIGIVLGIINNICPTFVDINERAVELTEKNCALNCLNGKIIVSDGFSKISEKFDTIVTNPPIRAGKNIIFSIYEGAYEHLHEGGKFYLVIRKKHGAQSTYNKLIELFGNCDTVYNKKGLFVYKCQK